MNISVAKVHQYIGHKSAVYALFDSGNHRFLSASGDGYLVEWDTLQPEFGRVVAQSEQQLFSLAIFGAHNYVLGDMLGGVHWIFPNATDNNRHIAHHTKSVFGIIRWRDLIFTAGGDGVLSKWDITQQRCIESLHISNRSLRSLDFSSTDHHLVVGSSDHHLYILDADNMRILQTIEQAHDASIFTVRYAPNGQYLFTGGRDALLKVWKLYPTLTLVEEIKAHLFTINDIVFSPDAKLFATASRDKTIKIWEFESLRLLKVINLVKNGGHTHSVNRLLWKVDGLFSASDDRTIIQWQVSRV